LEKDHTLAVSIEDLLEAGAHFGHQKRRWNPKMKRYIFEERNGVDIIDLSKTIQQLRSALGRVVELVENRRHVLFVGTKKQAASIIKESAERCGEFYVSERWLGGLLTNLATVRRSVKTLERIEKSILSGGDGFTKKEMTLLNKERQKLDRNISGIRAMRKLPGLLVVVDPNREHIAVSEANKLGIPVMGLVDTNCDPDLIDYVIACNDDSHKSIKLIISALTDKIVEVKGQLNIGIAENAGATEEPLGDEASFDEGEPEEAVEDKGGE